MKHTPGPWETTYDAVIQCWDIDQRYPHGIDARIRVYKGKYQSISEAQANARLIAAAPELLTMLKLAVARVEMANAEGNPIMGAWLPDAKAAIAKAEGVQP